MVLLYCRYSHACPSASPLQAFLTTAVCMVLACSNDSRYKECGVRKRLERRVRNFENLSKGLLEIHRVMKPDAVVAILEFSRPRRFPFKQFYNFYFKTILPKIGQWISRDKVAYTYLPESVEAFPDGTDFVAILKNTGFKNIACKPLTFGISSIYTAQK